jgi:hypothetical protein
MASWAMRILRYSWDAMESGIEAETIAGRLKEPKIVRPSRRRKAEYVAIGMRVRPKERAVLGAEDEDEDDDDVLALGIMVDVGVGVDVGAGVSVGVVAAGVVFGWPNSWANLTSFQIPTEELTINVVAKVVMPAMAWSILGYHLPRIVSVALAVAKVAV